ncbi:MAG: hypothetical protein HYZ34_03155, partial [Ignavibacteriae bacterium]|nr:hypothetical protein [Ignavibacteriota bacterium]
MAVVLIAFTMLALFPQQAEASHFRYGHLTWRPRTDVSASTIEFTLTGAFRRNGYNGTGGDGFPITGDIITENIGATGLNFGDNTSTGTLRFVITSYDVSNNWLIGQALQPNTNSSTILHNYPNSTGSYTAEVASCCRIGTLVNAANNNYRIFSPVYFTGNSSPVSSLTPIINMMQGGLRTFTVPASDGDINTALRFRLATTVESGIPNQPTGLAIDNTTGVV